MSKMDFDLRQLEIFCRIVELGSFSKAANHVFLAQASVSERIANLEKSVGCMLLDRLGRKVVPTKAGEIFYKHAVLMLDMKKTACLEMEDFLGAKKGEIHIGGSTIPGEFILPALLGQFRNQYQDISIKLTISNSGEIQEKVLAGEIELGIIGYTAPKKELIQYELWKDELVLAVPAKHKWSGRKNITIEELADEPFISRAAGSGTLRTIETYLKPYLKGGLNDLNLVANLGTSTAVKEGIKAGLGVSIISSKAIKTDLKAGMLNSLDIKGIPRMVRKFNLIRDKRRIASPVCRVMTEFLLGSKG